jgi:hypothetical protein
MFDEIKEAVEKIGISALLAAIAHVTLSQVAAVLSIIYSACQLYKLFKKK